MKIGIFPGSFNPVHIGHLAIANYICEFENYDEIWFLITPQNPVKGQNDLMPKEFRLELIENAIKSYPKFKTCTIEWEMSPPTYTVNTLQKLRVKHPLYKFELIIGSDNWEIFHRWKDYQMILKNFKIVVYPRKGTSNIVTNYPNVSIHRQAPKIEVSSSFIRKVFRKRKNIRFFLPEGAFEKIIESGFFEKVEPDEENSLDK
ncbi:MAG: nicotinate-nucleotide adenylyltransferase [Dysgonamonadaceae bacterium]|jgi:nicotinate-nucleotide adenylyltransferase|nr:nicotinate-nucleotide adenylyltransferase [Dysgonamonadaceae bacterium]